MRTSLFFFRKAFVLAALVIAGGFVTSTAGAGDLLIKGVTIVDVARGKTVPDQEVRVRGRTIEHAGPARVAAPRGGLKVVDGRGLYAIPALIDSHVHLNDPDREAPLLVANGVLFVRDLGGSTETRLATRAGPRAGELLGLDMVVTGTIVDGSPPYHAWSAACATPEEGRAAVRELHGRGVDQIKVYSLLKPEVYNAITDEAKRLGLKIVGHVPDSITLRDAEQAGQASVEHLSRFETLLADLLPPTQGAFASGYFGRYSEIDPAKLAARLKLSAAAGVAHCPTLVLHRGQARLPPDPATREAWSAYVDGSTLAAWTGPIPDQYAAYGRSLREAIPNMERAVRDLHAAGVTLLVGTDLGNVGVLAGFALHQEMLLWQEAGVPAPAVLRAATVAPAEFLGIADRYGAVAPGKVASFVLVRKDPLADVRNTAEIEAVVSGGRLFDRRALDGLLAESREEALARTPDGQEVRPEAPGNAIARGRYTLRYGDWTIGSEEFLITDDQGTLRLVSVVRQGSWEAPYVVRGELAPDGAIRRLTRSSLTKLPATVEYAADGLKLRVSARRGEKSLGATEIAGGDLRLATTAAGAYFLLRRLDLEVGAKRELTLLAHPVAGWQPDRERVLAERLPDEPLTLNGVAIPCRKYELRPVGGTSGAVRRYWLNASGLPVRVETESEGQKRSAILEGGPA